MELNYLLVLGSLSGLVAVLAHSVVCSIYALVRWRGANPSSRHEGSRSMDSVSMDSLSLTDAFLHLICGTGLGLLFWLSWGLAAIVGVPWWQRGLSFAMLCWAAVSLPAIVGAWIGAAPERGLSTRTMALMASRWATTCLIAGLACAWSWERSV